MRKPGDFATFTPSIFYDDASAAIDWLCQAFRFEVSIKIEGEGGRIAHSELSFGEGSLMVSEASRAPHRRSPRSAGRINTQSVMVRVPDVDLHCEQARKAGARILSEPRTNDYGEGYGADRTYEAEDLEGHHWWFIQRVGTPGK